MKIALVVDEFSLQAGTGIARYCRSLLAGLRDHNIDVTPIQVKPPQIPFGETFNHLFGIPGHILKRVNDFDLWHATSPVTALCFPLVKKPRVVTYHDLSSLLSKYSGSSLHVGLTAPLFYRLGRFSDKAIAVSTLTRTDLIRYLKFPPDKIAVADLGVDSKFKPRDKPSGRKSHIVGYLGALDRRKCLDYAFQAFHLLVTGHPDLDVKFYLYSGRGTETQRLVRLAGELGLSEHIRFMGFVEDDRLVAAYNELDVFVMPSDWEGFGLPVLEAQNCGVPVIVKENSHIPAEVTRCCLKAASEQDMADQIFRLLVSASFKDKTVNEALQYSRQFTWERMVEETIRVYRELL